MVTLLAIKLLIKLQKSRDLYHTIIQKQLEMIQKIWNQIEKFPKKGVYLQNKDRKILMI